MAPNGDDQDRKKASDLQKALETQLLALEKLGALPTHAADEVRNIVAEGIADKFGESYRTFPCAREGIEIRRDAVPKPCALRKSAQEFVAQARSPEKTTETKGREGQKHLISVAKTTSAKERATFSALAQVNKPQRNLGPTIVGHAARNEKAKPRTPVKQQPKTSPNPSDPTTDCTTKGWQQTALKRGEQAWSVYLAQKVAESKTPIRSGNQQKPKTQVNGSPTAPVTQRAEVGLRKDGQAAAAAATSKNATDAPNGATTCQSLDPAAGISGEAPGPRSLTGESANVKPPSSGKANSDSSEDLIDFDC
ncbi:hypothetical protein UCDDA912_g07794 [Diaporthe ampelina]|uniref:Uncharacterized protein n=1 Tax=Diaporthe ampelina TaxID=1214573 RepID=A0A0G2HAK6_9PEZI|nr:hypothetical protein UCDDA912_g07794 [Diaporthe ampelina]